MPAGRTLKLNLLFAPALLISSTLTPRAQVVLHTTGLAHTPKVDLAYRVLMARALILAKREAPQLVDVKVNDDGSIEGLTGKATEANAVLIAHFV